MKSKRQVKFFPNKILSKVFAKIDCKNDIFPSSQPTRTRARIPTVIDTFLLLFLQFTYM